MFLLLRVVVLAGKVGMFSLELLLAVVAQGVLFTKQAFLWQRDHML
jgi:hypothetical protein